MPPLPADEQPQVFYADPVDDDGNVVGTAHMGPVACSWLPEPIIPTKIPHSELAVEGLPTIHADLADLDDPE